MRFLNKHKNKLIFAVLIAALLAGVFLWQDGGKKTVGTDVSVQTGEKMQPENAKAENSAETAADEEPEKHSGGEAATAAENERTAENAESAKNADSRTGGAAVPQSGRTQAAEEPRRESAAQAEDEKEPLKCTLSISCGTILGNMDKLKPEKAPLVPKNGIILAERTVTFNEGESVFNLLLRETKKNKIHMEFHKTPVYSSAYIEGINNLYEFDCGELSGWMYRVNGEFPNYGCSRYTLKDGDRVEWLYTCDLGADIGSKYTEGVQKDE